MKLSEVSMSSFRHLGRELGLQTEMFGGRLVVIAPMWRRALSTESGFCKAVVTAGYLTERQMLRAASRYRLGRTRQGGVIFWQIDQEERIHDGKVMYYRPDCHRDKERHPTWVSSMLRKRDPFPDAPRQASHCLFGLHLMDETKIQKIEKINLHNPKNLCLNKKITTDYADYTDCFPETTERQEVNPLNLLNPWSKNIAVVEAEKSAVILSELFPQYLWLATGGLGEVQPEKFRPLRGRRVVLFPDTDPDSVAFRRWSDAASEVQRQVWWEGSPPIRVSPLLERRASPGQKERKIDLVDFLSEDEGTGVF